MLKHHGWASAIGCWAGAAFVAAALVASLWRARPLEPERTAAAAG
jgi:hypothetical protein